MSLIKPLPDEFVREFHETFGAPIADGAPTLDFARVDLRVDLIEEEFSELLHAYAADDVVGVADALGDLVYVIYGMALEAGIPLGEVLNEIHCSNMSKLGPDGNPILREDGKILKGPNYFKPDLRGVLERHGLPSPEDLYTDESGNAIKSLLPSWRGEA